MKSSELTQYEMMFCRVTKVREFQRVAKLCEADGHMQQKLKQLLKLSKEKWDAACEHAKTAVQVSVCGDVSCPLEISASHGWNINTWFCIAAVNVEAGAKADCAEVD